MKMTENKPVVDVILLSGGGLKGSYGAGAVKAIMDNYKLKEVARELCFVGNSAGALNAAVLAAHLKSNAPHPWERGIHAAERLIRIWLDATADRPENFGQTELLHHENPACSKAAGCVAHEGYGYTARASKADAFCSASVRSPTNCVS